MINKTLQLLQIFNNYSSWPHKEIAEHFSPLKGLFMPGVNDTQTPLQQKQAQLLVDEMCSHLTLSHRLDLDFDILWVVVKVEPHCVNLPC